MAAARQVKDSDREHRLDTRACEAKGERIAEYHLVA
jgi:hypothetical protein